MVWKDTRTKIYENLFHNGSLLWTYLDALIMGVRMYSNIAVVFVNTNDLEIWQVIKPGIEMGNENETKQ